MSPFEDGLSSNHFIAPFYGIFDLSVGYDSAIYFESRRKYLFRTLLFRLLDIHTIFETVKCVSAAVYASCLCT